VRAKVEEGSPAELVAAGAEALDDALATRIFSIRVGERRTAGTLGGLDGKS
jgi:hypothetical protein